MPETDRTTRVVVVVTAGLGAVGLLLSSAEVAWAAAAVVCAGLAAWVVLAGGASGGVTGSELDRLRQAEVALAAARDTTEAAQELAEHAVALLGARSAVVLIEGIGDTVRVSAGPGGGGDVYGSGSRMRLLSDAGVPCGSIAVSERADGRHYTPRHERILDVLAERVSSTLDQLSLLTQVQSERRKLGDLVSASSDGIFSVGSDLRVTAWNAAMEEITGVPASKALGVHVTRSFAPTGEAGAALHRATDPGRTDAPERSAVGRIETDGEQRWVTCSYSPLPDGGCVVVARDETVRKKVQDDKDGWIAQVSHELRTPLTPLKGFLHTLARRDGSLSTSERQKIYEVMLREEQRLEELVTSLLQATQLGHDSDTVVLVPEPLDWRAIVHERVDHARRQDRSRDIGIAVGPRVGSALADEQLADGVLANLMSNALKYSDPGASVQVEIERVGDELVTSVVDHGPGIPRSDRERVFDKFTRLGDHLTRPQQGVGLGLFIAKQSVERMGGRIWVDGTPGGGATFRFSLPVSKGVQRSSRTCARPVRPR